MKVIKEHIKSGKFKQFYLLYGNEDYLKNLYKGKLKSAILENDNNMNYSYFEGKDIDLHQISDAVQTLPFFSPRRLLILENSGLFKTQNGMPEILSAIPESTVIVFVEDEVDKRNRLYKLIKELGTVSEMSSLDEKNLKLFIVSLLEQEGKRISEKTMELFLEKCGTNMLNIKNEIDKLASFTSGRDIITEEDIEAVVTAQLAGKIFQMVDAIGSRKQDTALELYYDLLSLREKPMSILYMITRHFNLMLQVKDLLDRGFQQNAISTMVGIPPFVAGKCINQSRNFTKKDMMKALEAGAELEEQVKTGCMLEKIGIELLIISISAKK